MNFIPAFRSTRFKMSRVLTIVIALTAFGAALATSSSLYAQLARYSKDGGNPIVSDDRVTKVLTQGDPSLAVGDYVEADYGARHGATFTIPGGADFTIKPKYAYVSIDLTTVGDSYGFRFNNKTDNATLNLTNLQYQGGNGRREIFLHMDSGENNFLTLNLKNASFYSMKGVISSGNSNSYVKINSDSALDISSTNFVFGNWDNGNGHPLKVDLSFTDQNYSNLTLKNNTNAVCGSVAFTSGFTSESATLEIQSNRASDRGGAIYSTGNGDVSLTATSTNESDILRISSNTANSGGFMYSDSSGDIKITAGRKLSLTNNEALTGSGGAIFKEGNGSITLIATNKEMYVNGNSAGSDGGVIYNDSGENSYEKTVALYSNSNISSDQRGVLTITSNSADGDGGVIYNKGASVLLQSSTGLAKISANTANNGGAIYNDCSGNDDGIATVKIASTGHSVNLISNQATSGSGGAIYSVGSNVTLEAKARSVIIDENTAQISGGVIYNQGEATTKITIDGNKVIATDSFANTGSGGVVYNEGASMDIKAVEELTVKRSYAPAGNGGAIYSGDYNGNSAENVISIAAVNSSLTISNNYAGYTLGASESSPIWNTDGCKGGAIYSTAKQLLIAMNSQEGSTIGKISFENNFATGDGGAIYNVSSAASNALLSIQGNHDNGTVTVSRNKAGGSGGAIYNANAEIDLISFGTMSFQQNQAGISGGAIYNSAPAYDFNLECISLEFGNNTASENGGAIYLESKKNLIVGTHLNFKYNVAGENGGAIYEVATSGGSTTFNALNNLAITDNIANSGSGGAIYRTAAVDATEIGDLTFNAIDELVINRNYAENGKGGAIYNDANSDINFTSNSVLSIKNNKAINGGAIYQSGGGIVFDGTVIQDDPSQANFFNNVATGDESTLGEALANDLYCKDELSFVGNGVYTFNGGIYAGSTSISAADVTVYGREFLPGTETPDTTNHFRFNQTTISNDGKLTVQFDEIEDYSGVFTLEKKTENATMLELNTETKTRQLTMEESQLQVLGNGVVEKTGDGVLQVVAAAEGLVQAESFVISSGRVDFAGYVDASLEVDEGVFSPGSFEDADLIGKAFVIGDVQIEDSGTALFEFGTFPGNKEDVDHHDVLSISDGSFVFDPSDSGLIALEFLKGDEGSWAVYKCWYLLIEGANVADGDYTYLLRNAGPFNLVGAGGNLYLTSYVIPEPSTWALMILGAAGILYWRKKAVKK